VHWGAVAKVCMCLFDFYLQEPIAVNCDYVLLLLVVLCITL